MSSFVSTLPGAPQSLAGQVLYLLAGFVVFVALLVLRYPDRMIGTHSRKGTPPILPFYPLIGQSLWILPAVFKQKKILHMMLESSQQQPGFVFTATQPGVGGKLASRITILSHPLYLSYITGKQNHANYEKGWAFRNAMGDVLGAHGIFVADGEAWRKQRKMASNIFSVGNFRTHVQNTIHGDLNTLDTLLSQVAKTGRDVELQDLFFRFTLSSFASMAFSADVECLPSEPAGLDVKVGFATHFDYAQGVMDQRFIDPLGGFLERFNAQGRKIRKTIKALHEFCYQIIDLRLAARARGDAMGAVDSKAGKDLLELFMDMGLGRDELLPVVLNFLIAGRDTTAQTLSWMFFRLWEQPEIVAKIRAEAEAVLGAGADARKMEYDMIKDLPYLNAVFNETTRLHPAVPKNFKSIVQDDVIRPYAQPGVESILADMPPLKERLPDVVVRAGEAIIFSDYVMNRSPKIWGEDAEKFKPERFLTTREDGSTVLRRYSEYQFHSFNSGPRLCLGQTLATYEGMACAIGILSKFDVIYDDARLKVSPPMFADSLTHPIEADADTGSTYRVRFRPRQL